MILDSILGSGYASPTFVDSAYKKQNEEPASNTPLSWGADTVKFSPEAIAAQQSQASGDKQESESGTESAVDQFQSYMKKAKGEESSSGSNVKEQIEKLKEKLKKLTSQKVELASEEGTSEGSRQAKTEALDAEINQVISQIAELTSQLAEEESGGDA